MRKLLAIALCLLCLSPAVTAAETKYAALIVSGGPNGESTEKLLEGLASRNAKATFFLCGENLEAYPELAQRINAEGHELGLQGYGTGSMQALSRREIAKSLSDTRTLLPKGSHARFLRPPEGVCSDAVRQVAEVTGLAIIDCRQDIRRWAAMDNTTRITPVVELVEDGDVVLLDDAANLAVNTSLAMVDRLKWEGFQFVTLTELARIRGIMIHPGRTYAAFPPAHEE